MTKEAIYLWECRYCGKEYKSNRRNEIYCSDRCIADGGMASVKDESKFFRYHCRCCGVRFVANKRNIIYCSDRCRADIQLENRRKHNASRDRRRKRVHLDNQSYKKYN